jgi:hypothetical protein
LSSVVGESVISWPWVWLNFGKQGSGGFVGGVLGDEFAFEGFVEEGGGEFIDLGTGVLITGFEAITLIASLAISGVNQLRFAFSI